MPTREHGDGPRRKTVLGQPLHDHVLVFHPKSQIGLQIVRDLMKEHGLPWLVPVKGNTDERERVAFAQQATERYAAPHGGR